MSYNYSKQNISRRGKKLSPQGRIREQKKGKFFVTLRLLILIIIVGFLCVLLSWGIGAYRGIIDSAPDISNISVTPLGYATFVYDTEGNQTAKMVSSDSNRVPVTMDMIPKDLQHAFVAVEDARFYQHNGVDIQGILRAVWRGITTGKFDEGASTITQQLIKNSVFTNFTNETFSESVRRKIQEQYLAVQLEKTMSKDEILLNYLNIINLGHNTLGVQAAAQRYFGKSVSTLTLSEDAVIAGITQNPTRYDPINYPENNAKRRKIVLDDMLDQGWITQDEYDEAMADDVYSRIQLVDSESDDSSVNSYFVDALTDQVLEDLVNAGYTETQAYTLLYSGGLSIYSTQDPRIQEIADEEAADESNYPLGTKWYLDYQLSVSEGGQITSYSSDSLLAWMKDRGLGSSLLFSDKDSAQQTADDYREYVLESGGTVQGESVNITAQPQVSLTIEDQRTGDVLAIVGGRGDKTANRTLNRATSTLRQPGSTFKIVSTYAPALDAGGKTLATTYVDEPYSYKDGTPVRNWYGEAYRGTVTIRTAIRDSMNIIAVKTLTDITPELGYQYLLDFGFSTLVEREEINGSIYSDIQQTLALGGLTNGVKNIELNAAYATIANGGTYIEPKLYTRILDHDGHVLLDQSSRKTREVLRPATAWLLTSAMEDVVTGGTGTMCQISETPVAGKTGTTSDEHDAWFAGYTDYYTCTTWAGYDETTNLAGSEANIAKILWQAVMERVHEGMEYRDFTMPDTVERTTLCSRSMLLPVQGLCDNWLVTEYFDRTTLPTDYCDASYHQGEVQEAAEEATTEEPQTQQETADTAPTPISTAEAQQQVDAAQATLDQVNANVTEAAATLQQAQDALAAAQAGGDQTQIDAAQEVLNTAQSNYDAGLSQQQEAQAALDSANANLQEAQQEAEISQAEQNAQGQQ